MSDPLNAPLVELLARLEALRVRIEARAATDQEQHELIKRISERLYAIMTQAKEAGGE